MLGFIVLPWFSSEARAGIGFEIGTETGAAGVPLVSQIRSPIPNPEARPLTSGLAGVWLI